MRTTIAMLLLLAASCTGARSIGEPVDVERDAEALAAGASAPAIAPDAPAVCKREHFYGTYDVTFKHNSGDCGAANFPPEEFKINAQGIWVDGVKATCPAIELIPENIAGGCKVRFNTLCDATLPDIGPLRFWTERNLKSTDAKLRKWGGPMAVRVVSMPSGAYFCESRLTIEATKR